MRKLFTILLALLFNVTIGQESHLIKIYFLYGSKPAHGYKHFEGRYFGGIHGGHVSVEVDSSIIGFTKHNGFHIFSHRKNLKSIYYTESLKGFLKDTSGKKYTTFVIHLTDSQYVKLKKTIYNYVYVKTPYDYAFIGMRCASATYDLLNKAGLLKHKSKLGNIFSNFYPKKLRKKIFKLAKQNDYHITFQQGCYSRKWESD